MRTLLVAVALLVAGCVGPSARRQASFGPASVRVSPTFSRVTDGYLEADVELLDDFQDSVKGGGVLTLRLFDYNPRAPLVQGREVGGPATFDLGTVEAQRRFWQPVSRTYLLGVTRGEVRSDRTYLLVASYAVRTRPSTRPGDATAEAGRDERFFDRAVLRPRPRRESE